MPNEIWEGPYFRNLDKNTRIRYRFRRAKKEVIDYLVQLETDVAGKWKAVIRYDVCHGGPHKDIYRKSGGHKKEDIDTTYDSSLGYSEAFNQSLDEVTENWEGYYQRYTDGRWSI